MEKRQRSRAPGPSVPRGPGEVEEQAKETEKAQPEVMSRRK